MIVLTPWNEETILVGSDIEIKNKFLESRRGKVKIGIETPEEVNIVVGELKDEEIEGGIHLQR